MRLATGQHSRAMSHSVGYQSFNLFQCRCIDERALFNSGLSAIADLESGNGDSELFGKCVVDVFLHEQSIRAHTGLSAIAVLGKQHAFHGSIEIRIIEDDERCVAAELQ